MQIDSHHHFWNYDPGRDDWITEDMEIIRRDFLPGDLFSVLKENGMAGSVVVQADPSENETRFLLDIAGRYDFVKGVVGWIDLTDERVEERIAFYREKAPRLKGFRHIVQSEPDDRFLLRKDFCRGIKLLGQYGYTYDILIYPKHLPAAIEFAARFPEQKFVIDHMAKPDIKGKKMDPWAAQMNILAQNENVWCKVSGMITEADWDSWSEDDFAPYLEVVFEAFGTNRLLFGSDWPVCLVAGNYAKVKHLVVNYMKHLDVKEQEAVMGKNAVKFYQLTVNH